MLTSDPCDVDRMPGSVGQPLPEIETGMIEVAGPNVFKCYWRMPEKSATEFRPDGSFVTSDLGRVDDRGYVRIDGRGKDPVNTGGLNVYAQEVEAQNDEVPGVVASAVTGVPHPNLGDGVTATVVPEPDAELMETDIPRALNGRLSKFKQPKRIIYVEEPSRNTTARVRKATVRRRYADLYVGQDAH